MIWINDQRYANQDAFKFNFWHTSQQYVHIQLGVLELKQEIANPHHSVAIFASHE